MTGRRVEGRVNRGEAIKEGKMSELYKGDNAGETCPSGGATNRGDVNKPDKDIDAREPYPSGDCEIQLIVPAQSSYAAPRDLRGKRPRPR